MDGQVKVTDDTVVIKQVECSDPSVVEYFTELTEAQRPEAVCRALVFGVAGSRAMTARADVDQVDRGFDKLKREFQRAFDPERKNSYLGQLAETCAEFLGEDGAVTAAVAENGEHVLKTIIEQITQLRDAVVNNIATAAEREKGTAKGVDFESDVEGVLCRIAKSYGDSVSNVAKEAGDDGRSLKGDFVVTLAEGPVFTVEAKNKTKGITLRGEGILKALDASMTNRQAEFAIAVSKCVEALPKEVGPFNCYDDDKIVCAFGDDGAMLEVAYRWARTTLLLALEEHESEVDVEAVRSALSETLSALTELAKIKAKANSITKTAAEIQSIVEWQVAKARQALSQAEQALDVATLETKAS